MSTIMFSRRDFLKLSAAALASASGFGAVSAVTADEARQWRVTGPDVPDLAPFDQIMKQFMQERSIPGGSLAVSRQGKLVLARGYSWSANAKDVVQPTSLFRIASVTKPITAAAVMLLVQRGKLKVSQKLVDLIDMQPPKGKQADPRLKSVTVLHLLQHLGGWDRDRKGGYDPMFYDNVIAKSLNVKLPIGIDHIIHYMAGEPLDFDPGSKYVYSNFGYLLLGKIIEQISGKGYEAFVQNDLLKPMGITRMKLGFSLIEQRLPDEVSYYTLDTGKYASVVVPGQKLPIPYGTFNVENMSAHGRWVASAVDLVRFATSFDQPNKSSVLGTETFQSIVGTPATGVEKGDWWYGLGWAVRRVGKSFNMWHEGSLPGTTTLLVRRFDGLNWAALFNQRDDPSNKDYAEIDPLLHTAADSVKRWPDKDMFAQFA